MTFSIVARDTATGELGVAAQSCAFALGAWVPWARAGVGAVATQGLVERGYGPRCLDRMADGLAADDALDEVRSTDTGQESRQVSVVDAEGRVASFTGSASIALTCHAQGEGYVAQANMMARAGVCAAMAEAFEASRGPLAARLLHALVAGQAAGGDARGQMSAALVVVESVRSEAPWEGSLVDVRVDHHREPLTELARLVRIAQARERDAVAFAKMTAGDVSGGLAAIEEALALAPGEVDLVLSRMVALLGLGRRDEATRELNRVLTVQLGWAGVLRALAGRGVLPFLDPATLESMLPDPRRDGARRP